MLKQKSLRLNGTLYVETLEKLKKFRTLKIEKVHMALIILINGR